MRSAPLVVELPNIADGSSKGTVISESWFRPVFYVPGIEIVGGEGDGNSASEELSSLERHGDMYDGMMTDHSNSLYVARRQKCNTENDATRSRRRNLSVALFSINMTAQLAPLPLEIRLRALEARVRGVPATTLADAETETSRQKRSDNDEQPLTRRVAALRAKLDDAANTSPPIKQFLDNCAYNCCRR